MSDTPETDAFYDRRFESSATWEERFKDACDFARNLERQRNMLLGALEGIIGWWNKVNRGTDEMEDEEVNAIAAKAIEAIASVKQNSPYVGKES